MKTVHCFLCAFLVVSFLDITTGKDFIEILSSLSSDFGNAITDAWHSIIRAIKTPVKVRRLGRIRRKMRTPTPSTFSRSSNEESIEIISTPCHLTTEVPRRPIIPIILQPEWKSLLDWRILQRPNLAKLAQEFSNRASPSMYGRRIDSYDDTTRKLSTTNEDNHFEAFNKKPKSSALSADETTNYHFRNTQLVTTTEETGFLLKKLKFGKY